MNIFAIGMSMLLKIQDFYFAKTVNAQSPPQIVEGYSQNLFKVRYVAGMCVTYTSILHIILMWALPRGHWSCKDEKGRSSCVACLLLRYITIAKHESQCPDTLNEICHRQYKYGHFTVMDGGLFEMIVRMDLMVHTLLSRDTWFRERNIFFAHFMTEVLGE